MILARVPWRIWLSTDERLFVLVKDWDILSIQRRATERSNQSKTILMEPSKPTKTLFCPLIARIKQWPYLTGHPPFSCMYIFFFATLPETTRNTLIGSLRVGNDSDDRVQEYTCSIDYHSSRYVDRSGRGACSGW